MPIPGMTGGKATPIAKYNAEARLWKVDDVSLNSISFVVDRENMEAGWSLFRENTAPDFVMVRVEDLENGKPYPTQPSEDHRKSFRVPIKIPDKLATGKASVREFASNSLAVRRAVDNLYDVWLVERKAHPNRLPVVTCKTYEEVTSKNGSNFAPVFQITKWIDRPADLGKPNGAAAAAGDVPPNVLEVEGEPEEIGEPEEFSVDPTTMLPNTRRQFPPPSRHDRSIRRCILCSHRPRPSKRNGVSAWSEPFARRYRSYDPTNWPNCQSPAREEREKERL